MRAVHSSRSFRQMRSPFLALSCLPMRRWFIHRRVRATRLASAARWTAGRGRMAPAIGPTRCRYFQREPGLSLIPTVREHKATHVVVEIRGSVFTKEIAVPLSRRALFARPLLRNWTFIDLAPRKSLWFPASLTMVSMITPRALSFITRPVLLMSRSLKKRAVLFSSSCQKAEPWRPTPQCPGPCAKSRARPLILNVEGLHSSFPMTAPRML